MFKCPKEPPVEHTSAGSLISSQRTHGAPRFGSWPNPPLSGSFGMRAARSSRPNDRRRCPPRARRPPALAATLVFGSNRLRSSSACSHSSSACLRFGSACLRSGSTWQRSNSACMEILPASLDVLCGWLHLLCETQEDGPGFVEFPSGWFNLFRVLPVLTCARLKISSAWLDFCSAWLNSLCAWLNLLCGWLGFLQGTTTRVNAHPKA